MTLPYAADDGGRAASGRRGTAGDCVTRAIAIASGLPYDDVYNELARRSAAAGYVRSARAGVHPKIYKAYLAELGFAWTPTMEIGSGCQIHLSEELLSHAYGDATPTGRLVVRLSRHLTAVVDGEIRDTFDPSRDGTRCVYGYWKGAVAVGERRPL